MARDDIVGLIVGVGILGGAVYAISQGWLGKAVDALLNLKLPDIGLPGGGSSGGGTDTGGGGTDTGGDGGSTGGTSIGNVTSFVAAGDWGTCRNSNGLKTADAMIALKPQLVLGLGDYGYQKATCQKGVVDKFNAAKIPNFWSKGNHDGDSGYLPLFKQKDWVYSFESNDAIFISLDGNSTGGNAAALEAALKNTNKKWRVVFFHQPIVSPSSSHGEDTKSKATLMPILQKYKVQLVLQGHNHIFFHGVTNGITFVISGMAGESPYPVGSTPAGTLKAFNSPFPGFVQFTIGATSMTGKYISTAGQTVYTFNVPV